MGYGYGVWLVISDHSIQQIVDENNTKPHIAHITVMCNMNDIDAFKLARELDDIYNTTILNRYIYLNENGHKYSNNDKLHASGYYCIVDKWREITEIAKYYNGSIPKIPHLSIAYRNNNEDLPTNIDTKNIKVEGYVGAININDSDPSNWYYINQTKPFKQNL